MTKVSAIILTKNCENLIEECLESIKWIDEIVVVDDHSTDTTVDIVKKHKDVTVVEGEGDFSRKRNLGAKNANGEWLFYIDADERVTPLLKKEIEKTIEKKDAKYSAYAIPRRNILLGHEMHYGGWWPDYVLRLIKKEKLVTWEGKLHEQPKIRGKVGKLKNPLTHITHRSLSEMVAKTNEWSNIEARLLYKSGHPKMAWWRFISVAFREFWYRGVKKMGFLDGTVGVIEIIYQMYSRMITYAKLWELQKKDESSNL